MPSRGPQKHCCKVCNKNFTSGRALGGHMTIHRHAGRYPKDTPIPPVILVDLPVSLLGPSDEKPLLSSLETHCLHCSKEFSSCHALRGDIRMPSEKKEMAKSNEEPEPAELMETLANANGDHGHNVMLFSPVKRKRSKRGMSVLESEMDAATALLMLAEHSNKTSPYEDCCGVDKDDNVSKPEVLREVNLNAFDQLVQSDEFANNRMLKSDESSAYEGLHEHCDKENSLNLAAFVPNKMVLLNVFDHRLDEVAEFMKPRADITVDEKGNSLNVVADVPKKEVLLNVFGHGMDVDAESIKSGADISLEQLKSSDPSAAVNIKKYQCKVCGKLLRSGQALGSHMTLHSHFGKENSLDLVADVPKEVLLNAFYHRLDVDVEFMKPGAAISVGGLKSSDLSAAVNLKEHQCKVCGKLLRSGHALGGHMRLHHVRKCNLP
ncbi:hypothetical protein BS78_08G044600 [Paspalum vaginatum]|nr:hypothetical protein BS78_08G044600 [Paspalum vaginatum]